MSVFYRHFVLLPGLCRLFVFISELLLVYILELYRLNEPLSGLYRFVAFLSWVCSLITLSRLFLLFLIVTLSGVHRLVVPHPGLYRLIVSMLGLYRHFFSPSGLHRLVYLPGLSHFITLPWLHRHVVYLPELLRLFVFARITQCFCLSTRVVPPCSLSARDCLSVWIMPSYFLFAKNVPSCLC